MTAATAHAIVRQFLLFTSRIGWFVESFRRRLRLGYLGKQSRLYRTVKIYVPKKVRIGSGTVLNDYVHIWGGGGIAIGNDCLIASHVVITSQSHDPQALRVGSLYRDTNTAGPVSIGDNVWIGSHACILPGVSIGAGSIVAAGAVVTQSVRPATLVAGVPARFIRHLK